MTGFKQDMWTSEHDEIIKSFLVNDDEQRMLVFYMDSNKGLTVARYIPLHQVDQLFYMIRRRDCVITPENFTKTVQYQLVRSNYIESLLRLMSGVYGPMFFQNKTWPDSILIVF